MIKAGNKNIIKVRAGTKIIKAIYIGSQLVWEDNQ